MTVLTSGFRPACSQISLPGRVIAARIGSGIFAVCLMLIAARPDFADDPQIVQAITLAAGLSALVAVTVLVRRSIADNRQTSEARALAISRQNRFERVLDASTDLVTIVDSSGSIVYQNSTITGLLGRYPWEVLGQQFVTLASGVDQYQAGWLLATARTEGRSPVSRLRLDASSGQARIVEAVATNCLDDPAVEGIVVSGRDITAQVRFEASVAEAANHDPLTGMVNRTVFLSRVEAAVRRAVRLNRPTFVALIDLDNFRRINEETGYEAGDQILKVVADRLRSIAGNGEVLGRLHSDTFGFLLEEIDEAGTTTLLELAREILSQTLSVEGRVAPISACIGFSCAGVDGAATPADSISEAEAALETAKRRGPGSIVRFESTMATPVGQFEFESELTRALEQQEFILHYQPVVSLDTCDIVEMEALIRWQHPVHGLILPGLFIPIAEQTGLVTTLGWWVLEEACRQGAMWLEARADRQLMMSVNISPRMFQQPDMIERTTRILSESGFPANQLRLEITESVVIEDLARTADLLGQFKAMGVKLAMDDFGTGFSSLAYLQHFPIDVIKIDRQFITSMADNHQSSEIVRSIVGLAKRLNLETTGEGIETSDQLATLRELGSDRGQGFLFSHPLPASELDVMVVDLSPQIAAA